MYCKRCGKQLTIKDDYCRKLCIDHSREYYRKYRMKNKLRMNENSRISMSKKRNGDGLSTTENRFNINKYGIEFCRYTGLVPHNYHIKGRW